MNKNVALLIVALLVTINVSAQRIPAKGFAVMKRGFDFSEYEFTRREVGDNDIEVKIMYAAICHSDLHEANEDWYEGHFPFVPGHENVGKVVRVGKNVTRFKVGDYAGVGPSVNACRKCAQCLAGRDNYCEKMISCYNSVDYYHGDEITQGGYSDVYVLDADFAYKIPKNADLKRTGPLLCAGVTTWVPLHKLTKVKKGDKIAVAGFGGLGHMAMKYALELGAEVTVFDISETKRQVALKMGAVKYVNVNHEHEMQGMEDHFDLIISTIPSSYSLATYLRMVKYGGSLCVLGAPANKDMPNLEFYDMMWNGGKKVFFSMDGSVADTQECIDYSVRHKIYPDVEIIPANANAISDAYRKVKDGKVKFRYVIDMWQKE